MNCIKEATTSASHTKERLVECTAHFS